MQQGQGSEPVRHAQEAEPVQPTPATEPVADQPQAVPATDQPQAVPVPDEPQQTRGMKVAFIVTRYLMPGLIAAVGVVLIVMGHGKYKSVFANRDSLLSALGVGFIIIALMLVLLNWMMQFSAESDDDRAREDAAREHFARTGEWPEDEQGS